MNKPKKMKSKTNMKSCKFFSFTSLTLNRVGYPHSCLWVMLGTNLAGVPEWITDGKGRSLFSAKRISTWPVPMKPQ